MMNDQRKPELDAIQSIVIQARFVAYNNGSYQEIAFLLDQSEYLLGLLSTEAPGLRQIFEDVLKEVAEKDSKMLFVYKRYMGQ